MDYNGKRALVTGAGGFIGGHLVQRLLGEGCNVVAVDKKPLLDWWQAYPRESMCLADSDLSDEITALSAVMACGRLDYVFHLAADMGGMGFISTNDWPCMQNVKLTVNMIDACARLQVPLRFFYASSACVYPDKGTYLLKEEDAYPAFPDSEYGWEKLFCERYVAAATAGGAIDGCTARFHNVYGHQGTWEGGREKAPAAMCRKVIQALREGHTQIKVWGDGSAMRSYLFVDDCVTGILKLASSGKPGPYNIGSEHMVSVDVLASIAMDVAKTSLNVLHEPGPVGVRGRGSDNTRVTAEIGWRETVPLEQGLAYTYRWIAEQVDSQRSG